MDRRRQHGYRHRTATLFGGIGLMMALSLMTVPGAEPGSERTAPPPGPGGQPRADDSLPSGRNIELETAIRRASPFASEAQRQGLTVSDDEVTGRLEIYKKLYPNQALDASRTRRLLLAEKYLESKGLGAGGEEPEGVVVKKADPALFPTPQETEMVRKTAVLEALLRRDDLYREAKKLEELAHFKQESERVPTPLWNLEEIQLEGDSKECLAWRGSACFVNLGEFNAAAVQFRIQAALPLDSARAWVMKRYLLDKTVAAKGSALEVDKNPDSLRQAQKRMRDTDRWIRSARALGTTVQDLRTLQSLYGKHYHEYFAAGEEATLDIIGSSDSAYVDSLHAVLAAWQKRRGAKPAPGKQAEKEPALPWIPFKEKDLPRELSAVTDSFHVGQFSAPFRAPMGFFIVRLSKLAPRDEVSFDDAVPRLIYLATRNRFLELDSILEAQARRYYAKNKAQFALPDTLELLSWLAPRETAMRDNPRGAKTRQAPKPDTARFKPLAMSSLKLPREMQVKLYTLARADSQATCFGPLQDGFGRWHFRIRSRKLAHDTLPFRLVRREIVEKISSPLPEQPSGLASEESLDAVLLTLGTAMAVRRKEFVRNGPPDGSGGPGREPANPPSGATEGEKVQAVEQAKARLQAEREKKKLQDEEALRTTRINYSRLLE